MPYLVYGNKIKNGIERYESFATVKKYHQHLPMHDKFIRKLDNPACVHQYMQEILKYAADHFKTKEHVKSRLSKLFPEDASLRDSSIEKHLDPSYTNRKDAPPTHQPSSSLSPPPAEPSEQIEPTQQVITPAPTDEATGASSTSKIETSDLDSATLPNQDLNKTSTLILPGYHRIIPRVRPLTHLCLPHTITFYTDGSFYEPAYGGFSAIALDGDRPIAFLADSAIAANSTESELRAIHLALTSIIGKNHKIYIYSDCLAVISHLNGNKQKMQFTESGKIILNETLEITKQNEITISHIQGHAGQEWNTLADTLAKQQANTLRQAATKLQLQTINTPTNLHATLLSIMDSLA